jgi:uncharacterized protein involved in tellurium resistance
MENVVDVTEQKRLNYFSHDHACSRAYGWGEDWAAPASAMSAKR